MKPGINLTGLVSRYGRIFHLAPFIAAMLAFWISPLCILAQSAPAEQGADKTEAWKQAQIDSQFARLVEQSKDTGLAEALLGDYGGHAIRLLVRTSSGQAEVHTHSDDIFVVTEGEATLVTGGTVVDPKVGENGEVRGSSIRDGHRRTISVGDVAHIPAGTPHQTLLQPGTVFKALLIKETE